MHWNKNTDSQSTANDTYAPIKTKMEFRLLPVSTSQAFWAAESCGQRTWFDLTFSQQTLPEWLLEQH